MAAAEEEPEVRNARARVLDMDILIDVVVWLVEWRVEVGVMLGSSTSV